MRHRIAVARGDGIGPEIMEATLSILDAAGAPLQYEFVEIGEKSYMKGVKTGIPTESWDVIRNARAFLKAPLTTPQGGGYSSVNVALRSRMGLYANVRHCVAYSPYVPTKHPGMDVVIVRENQEDLYTGDEYRLSGETRVALKMTSQSCSEKIIRYAFEYALAHGRKKVTCFTKDNILKQTDGLFHQIFREIALEYPTLEHEHWIVDIGAAKLADRPNDFDVIVLQNLYGDILSDVAAQIAGSVGIAASSNIGAQSAMFEAIHGSAPRRAGQDVANPSGLILSAVEMLSYLGEVEGAQRMHAAWLKTIEDGIHTYDIYREGVSRVKVGTAGFARAVIARLGQQPSQLQVRSQNRSKVVEAAMRKSSARIDLNMVGVDLFLSSEHLEIAHFLDRMQTGALELKRIKNQGSFVWPQTANSMMVTGDIFICRFQSHTSSCSWDMIVPLIQHLCSLGANIVHVQPLYE